MAKILRQNKKRILVTGGAGFIGSHLVDKLIELDHKVVVIDNLSNGRKENLNKKAKFYKVDVCSPKISEIFKKEKPEIVFHLAAQINVRKSVENPRKDAKINILGSLNILENCKKYKVEKLIFASTGGAIYGEAKEIPTKETYLENPVSPYGISKLTVERYLNFYYQTFNLPYLSLRFSNVYGPRQNSKSEAGVIAIFIERMLKNQDCIIYGDGQQTRDFIYVKDVVNACLKAMETNKVGVYNIGTGKETSINEIFKRLKNLIGSTSKPIYEKEKPGDLRRSSLDITKAKKELKWQPKWSLEEGLKETIEWFKNL